MHYDVIVVGARCSGAALAALLARSGVRTLLLDAQVQPSDMPMSTHYVHPPGMDALDELGVGDAVRRSTPPSRRLHIQLDAHHFHPAYPDARAAYCVRRSTIDPLLQQAAIAAGAELRDGCRVTELLQERGRVCGVVMETSTGRERVTAGLVVGADGRNSTVARLAGAEEYLSFDMTRGGYWFYFPTPAIWREDSRFAGWDAFIGWQGDGLRYVFQCDGDVLLLAAMPPNAEARSWRGDYRQHTLDYLRRSEVTRPLVEASEPIGKGVGLLKAKFFYRRPVGPGFALVGDAGTFKDFVTGHGMTDAFLGAKRLHAAILVGTDAAYERYWRARDVETLPLYLDALRLGDARYNDAFNRLLYENMARDPELAARLPAIADRRISPLKAFSSRELTRMVLRAVLRGRINVVPPFLRAGKRMDGFKNELRRREALLRALDSESVSEPLASLETCAGQS